LLFYVRSLDNFPVFSQLFKKDTPQCGKHKNLILLKGVSRV